MTLETKDSQNQATAASAECHVVSSSDEDAAHEARDVGITSLLSAAALLSPLQSVIESSAVGEQTAQFRGLSAVRKGGSANDDGRDTASESPRSIMDKNERQSARIARKRKSDTVYDPSQLSTITSVNPSQAELEAATTDRTMNALLSWYDRLRELHLFKAKYGHADVPQQFPENHALGIWVNKQRMQRRLCEKDKRRRCFQWAKPKGDESWDFHYEELTEFYLQHNHCNVPTKYAKNKALGRWVSTNRSQMKKWKNGSYSLMTNERYEKLCKLGFHFELLPSRNKVPDGESESEGTQRSV